MVLAIYGSGAILCISARLCVIFDIGIFGYVFDNIYGVL